jgi:glycosyltransferase involved in cell wall biosynthesis
MVTVWGSDLLIKPTRSWVFRALARWVLRKADYVTCVSEQLVEEARELGADPTKLEMAPWGIDRTVFHPAEREATLREALNLGPGPVVLSLRPIKPIYNPMDLAYAIPKVLEQVPDAQFIVRTYACHRDLLEQFRSIIARYDATQAVRYVGDLPDEQAIANLYRAADVAVSVPSSDGTPLSVLEALACGTVPVLSDLPSLRAWVRHEVEGLFVPLGDVQAISDSIVRLLIDEELRQRMSQRGSTLIRKRADRQVWMAHAEDLYKQLLYH